MLELKEFPGRDEESPNEKNPKRSPKGWMRYLGIFFAICSSVVFSLSSVVIKTVQSYHAFNIASWGFQGVLFPSIIILTYYRITKNSDVIKNVSPLSEPESRKNILILFIRGFLAGMGVLTQVYSLQYLNLADSTVIIFSTSVFVTFLAHFILGEKLGYVPVLISIFTLGGVFVITRPPILTGESEMSTDNLIGIGMALTCMLIQAFIMIVLRFLRNVKSILIMSSHGFVGTTLCVTLALILGQFQFPEGTDWLFAMAFGGLTFFGQVFYTLALQYEEAGPVALVRTCDVIFSFIWQIIFLDTQPDAFSLIGAAIIMTGVLVIGFRKWVNALPDKNETKIRFRCLLL